MSVVPARLRVSPKLRATDGEHATKLRSIQTRDEVAELLEIPSGLLRAILFGGREREKYRAFDIPKRGGGIRTIKAPPKNLKILQEKLNRILSTVYKPKACVHGFAANRSVCTNAYMHHGRRWVLNVDLADFFAHVTIGRIVGSLMSPAFGVGRQAATTIAQIACLADGILPQGSPCSPVISNIGAYDLDVRLTELARESQCSYSRYADDISFSTSKPQFPDELAEMAQGEVALGKPLVDAIEHAGFCVNPIKVRLQHRRHRQAVTGLTVNEFPNVGRRYVRELRAILHSWREHGYTHAQNMLNCRLEMNGKHVRPLDRYTRGKLAYLEAVRGTDDPVVRKLLKALQLLRPELVRNLSSLADIEPSPLRGHRSPALAWENINRRLQKGVYFLEVDTVIGDKAAGTAFKLTDVLLATAGHNLAACGISVSPASDMEASIPAEKLKWRDVAGEADAGLLRFPRDILTGPSLISQQRLPEVGEQVAAIGFPTQPLRHPTLSLNVGVVESLPVSLQGYRFIQVSFQGGGGLSGAPLLDRGGYVVGIITENVSDQPHDGKPIPRSFAQATPAEYLYDLWRGGSGSNGSGA